MTYIRITASQIKDVLMRTELVEGNKRLVPYYNSFSCLEGIPVIERINESSFRLITYYENYDFYKKIHPYTPFECQIKEFNNDSERLLELLKQLFHGKARSSRREKYIIINLLYQTLTVNEIAIETLVPSAKISEYIYEDDEYKTYREYAMTVNKRSTAESVIKYLKENKIFKKEAETFLLNWSVGLFTDKSLTKNNWDKLSFILGNINFKFNLLSSDNQVTLINEVILGNMNILTNYFSNLCDELLSAPPPNDGIDDRPPVQ